MRRAAMVQLPACRSVKMTRTPVSIMRSRSNCSMSCTQRSRMATGISAAPRPVIAWTAEMSPAANSPWPATIARGVGAAARPNPATASSLIVIAKIPHDVGAAAHLAHQAFVELFGGVHTTVLEQMFHCNYLGDHRDVLSGIERH